MGRSNVDDVQHVMLIIIIYYIICYIVAGHRRDGGSAASNEYYLKGCELRILCYSIMTTASGSKGSFLHDES